MNQPNPERGDIFVDQTANEPTQPRRGDIIVANRYEWHNFPSNNLVVAYNLENLILEQSPGHARANTTIQR